MIHPHVHQELIKAIIAQLNLCHMGLFLSKRLLYNGSSFIFELHGTAEMFCQDFFCKTLSVK